MNKRDCSPVVSPVELSILLLPSKRQFHHIVPDFNTMAIYPSSTDRPKGGSYMKSTSSSKFPPSHITKHPSNSSKQRLNLPLNLKNPRGNASTRTPLPYNSHRPKSKMITPPSSSSSQDSAIDSEPFVDVLSIGMFPHKHLLTMTLTCSRYNWIRGVFSRI